MREIYLDRETGRPEWVLVDVDSDESRFVPLADASVESSTIRVAHSADAIRNAPGIGAEPRIDQSEERRLYAHYGLGYSEADSGSGLPADVDEPTREQQATGPAPTASEAPDSDAASAPADPWKKSEADAEPSSWSAAAEEPANLAPAPAEPPSVEELDSAEIPAPAIDRVSEAAPAFAATTDPTPPRDVVTPPVFTPPVEPSRIHSVPPPPPLKEPPSTALNTLAERKTTIAAGAALALILLIVLRRRR